MEFNWGLWKLAILFGLLSAGIIFLTALLTFDTPPTLWQLTKVAIIPACLNFLTLLLQKCFQKPINFNSGGVTK